MNMKVQNKTQDYCKNCRKLFPISKLQDHYISCMKENLQNMKYNESPFRKIETSIVKLQTRNSEKDLIAEFNESIATFGNNQKDKVENTHTNTNGIGINPNKESKDSNNNTLKSGKRPIYMSKKIAIGICNPIGANNSFVSVIIHTIFNMKVLRRFLQEESKFVIDNPNKLGDIGEAESNNFLISLHSVIKEYKRLISKNSSKLIDIETLRKQLSELFFSRRKFLLNQSDDPVDFLFIIINALHSYYVKEPLNEYSDTICHNKCISHNYLWLDLCKIDKCECGASKKMLYSYQNYVFDIPFFQIFESFQHKAYDSKGNLFIYFRAFVDNEAKNCPKFGKDCKYNKVKKKLFISQIPYYLIFNYHQNSTSSTNVHESESYQDNNNTNQYGLDILYAMLLLPMRFELYTLFEHNKRGGANIDYEILNLVCKSKSHCYTYYLRTINEDTSTFIWVYIDDDKITYYENLFEVVSNMIKKSEFPIMVVYQLAKKEKEVKEEDNSLSKENFSLLSENITKIKTFVEKGQSNRFRPKEKFLNYDQVDSSKKIKTEDLSHINQLNKINQINHINQYTNINSQSNLISTNITTTHITSTTNKKDRDKDIIENVVVPVHITKSNSKPKNNYDYEETRIKPQQSMKNIKSSIGNSGHSVHSGINLNASKASNASSNVSNTSSAFKSNFLTPSKGIISITKENELIKKKLDKNAENQKSNSFLRSNSNSNLAITKNDDSITITKEKNLCTTESKKDPNKDHIKSKLLPNSKLIKQLKKEDKEDISDDKEYRIKLFSPNTNKINKQKDNKDLPKQKEKTSMGNLIELTKKSNIISNIEKAKTNSLYDKNKINKDKDIIDVNVINEPCPCIKITNRDNIIFSNNICKLCGINKFIDNIQQNTEGSLVNYNIGTSIGSELFNNKIKDLKDKDGVKSNNNTEGSLVNFNIGSSISTEQFNKNITFSSKFKQDNKASLEDNIFINDYGYS